jgi:hypothetical protein
MQVIETATRKPPSSRSENSIPKTASPQLLETSTKHRQKPASAPVYMEVRLAQPAPPAEPPGVKLPVPSYCRAVELGRGDGGNLQTLQKVQLHRHPLNACGACTQLVIGTAAPTVHLSTRCREREQLSSREAEKGTLAPKRSSRFSVLVPD